MPSLYDAWPTGDDPGPDTDPTPDDLSGDENISEDDQTDYTEPGQGMTFSGSDPSVWSGRGDPDEPEDQNSDVPPTETEEQTATVPGEGDTLDQSDDPEYQEHLGDEQAGDDEDDRPVDPADIDAGRLIDATDEVRYPEQGFEQRDVDYSEPWTAERAAEFSEAAFEFEGILADIREIPEAVEQELADYYNEQAQERAAEFIDYVVEFDRLLADVQAMPDAIEWELSGWRDLIDIDLETDASSEFDDTAGELVPFGLEDISDPGAPELEADLTTPSLLVDFGDIVGGVEIDTLLVEFGLINVEDV